MSAKMATEAQQAQKALRQLNASYRLRVALNPDTQAPECFTIEDTKGRILWAGPRPPTIEEIGELA